MKKLLYVMLLSLLVFNLNACKEDSPEASQDENQTEETAADETVNEETMPDESESEESSENKILIAYFTWADNTIVLDEQEAIDSALAHYQSINDTSEYTDAASSASMIQPGNVAKMAQWIQEEIGGDLFSIQVSEPYPSNYDECLDRAANEKAENARPELISQVENLDEYDTIFLGYPNWWYSVPTPVLSFIEENDLSDKKVVLFCSHGTGGLSRSVQDIESVLPESAELESNVIGVFRDDINQAQPDIQNWLTEIGY